VTIQPSVALLKGLVSYVPGLSGLGSTRKTGGTVSARYCYSVWLRHLVKLAEVGCLSPFGVVAEFGPGDSIGTGLAALLSGAKNYIALDVVAYAENSRNKKILHEIAQLFKENSSVPGEDEFPEIRPLLSQYSFPRSILADEILAKTLNDLNIENLSKELAGESALEPRISYIAPWNKVDLKKTGFINLIFSQAVLEHVDDISTAYSVMHNLLAPGGIMSHQIDFRSHGISNNWNGHWGIGEFRWNLTKGKRPYLINRIPYSKHISLIEKSGFKILATHPIQGGPGIKKSDLAPEFKDFSDEDLETSGAMIIAKKL